MPLTGAPESCAQKSRWLPPRFALLGRKGARGQKGRDDLGRHARESGASSNPRARLFAPTCAAASWIAWEPGNDGRRGSSNSRNRSRGRFCPSFALNFAPLNERGRRESRMPAASDGLACKVGRNAHKLQSPQDQPDIRLSLHDGRCGLCRVSPEASLPRRSRERLAARHGVP